MQRWVNDYNLVGKIEFGYRPVLPFDIKDVGGNTQAMLMEIPDADYKFNQTKKQIMNDKISPTRGYDLNAYKKDVAKEAKHLVMHGMTKWQMINFAIRKLFGFCLKKYMDKILTKDAVKEQNK